MSWLSGIAGKAEALLDRMDQVAASSIQNTGLATPPRAVGGAAHQTSLVYEPTASVAVEKSLSVPSKPSTSSLALHKPVPYSPVAHPEPPPQTTPTPASYHAYSKSKTSAPSDDSLFQFLNTPSRQQASRKPLTAKDLNRQPSDPPSARPNLEQGVTRVRETVEQPLSEDVKVERGEGGREGEGEGGGEGEGEGGGEGGGEGEEAGESDSGFGRETVRGEESCKEVTDSGRGAEVTSTAQANSEQIQDSSEKSSQDEDILNSIDQPSADAPDSGTRSVTGVVQHQPTVTGRGGGGGGESQQMVSLQRKVSDLELENKLLKREVSSLNDELSTVLERVREAEEGVALHRSEMETLQEQLAASDHVIRQLRSHDEDIQATLQARESQIQVLRKELQQSERREAVLSEKLHGQGREKERLLQDVSLSSEASSRALSVVKEQLQVAEERLTQEREAATRAKMEFAERESVLHCQQQQLSDAVTAQQRQLSLLQSKVADSQRAVQAANRELSQANREHDDYKKRAAGILQAKEKLITSLQEGGCGVSGPSHEASLEQLQLERDALKTELETARFEGVGLREELREAEDQHSHQLNEQVRELESALVSERTQQRSAAEELQRLTAELEGSREAWGRERGSLTALLEGKTEEVAALNTKVSGTPLSPNSITEMESRLHELTESLIQKQTTLEALSSEKHSLKLQLERTEGQLLDARRVLPPPSLHTAVNGLEGSIPTETHIRPMASMLPSAGPSHSDSRLHNVRRAMNTFDTFSVRLAVFLRRYPYARLFLLFYMVLLHVWVLVVLLTYSPEVHDMEDLTHEPKL